MFGPLFSTEMIDGLFGQMLRLLDATSPDPLHPGDPPPEVVISIPRDNPRLPAFLDLIKRFATTMTVTLPSGLEYERRGVQLPPAAAEDALFEILEELQRVVPEVPLPDLVRPVLAYAAEREAAGKAPHPAMAKILGLATQDGAARTALRKFGMSRKAGGQ